MNELNEAAGWLRGATWLGLGLIALWAVIWVVRYLRASPMERISIRQTIRIRWGWKRLAQMCGLSVTDKMPAPLASLANTDGTPPKPRVLVPALKVKAMKLRVGSVAASGV